MPFVYILKSLKDSKKYIGSTINLEHRVLQHNRGEVFSTKYRRPLILYAYQTFETIEAAAVAEKKDKRSHGFLERKIKSGDIKVVYRGVV